MDRGGFTFDWTKNDAVATQILYLALESKPTSYGRFRSITVPTSSLGASCTTSLTNFPLLVSLSNDAELRKVSDGGYVQNANGYDIVFTDAYNNRLDHEIEQYTSAAGGANLVAWVRVPTLSILGPTTIYMRYGNASISSPTANPAGVWDSGYKGVWHLAENPAGAAPQMKDSTANASHGTTFGAITVGQQVPGRIAGALNFDGTNDYVTGPIVGPAFTQYTYEAWINENTTLNPEHHIIALDNTQFFVESNDKLEAGTTSEFNLNGPTSIVPGTWYHASFVQMAAGWTIYVNGQPEVSGPNTTVPGLNFTIGVYFVPATGGFFPGLIDEARISNVPRSQCWIETEYKNVTTVGFITFGTPTAVRLVSFDAAGLDGAVELSWRTASELDNLGFYLYRSLSEAGPWTRLTASLIPGLGSSAVGQAYSYRDAGPHERDALLLPPGGRRRVVEDDLARPGLGGTSGRGSGWRARQRASGEQPEREEEGCCRLRPAPTGWWRPTARWPVPLRPRPRSRCTRHGDPEAVSLGVVSRDSRTGDARAQDGRLLRAARSFGQGARLRPRLRLPAGPAGSGTALPPRARGRGRRAKRPARRGAGARPGGLPGPRPDRARQGRDAGFAGRDRACGSPGSARFFAAARVD